MLPAVQFQARRVPLLKLKYSVGANREMSTFFALFFVLGQLSFDPASQDFLAQVRVILEPCLPLTVQLECCFLHEASTSAHQAELTPF